MQSWQQNEFLLKGLYLGLLVMVAWQVPTWAELAWVGLATAVGLVLALAVAAIQKLREGFSLRGRLVGFILFLVLEHPRGVFGGILGGLTAGAFFLLRDRTDPNNPDYSPLLALVGGAAFGMILYAMRHVRDHAARLWMGLALAILIIGGVVGAMIYRPEWAELSQLRMLGWLLLLGLPGFYLLTFAGVSEESEVEVAAMCAALGVGLWTLSGEWEVSQTFRLLLSAAALAVYYMYTVQILPGLRVFKHALRGISYKEMGNTALAMASLRRALQWNPQDRLARNAWWDIHRHLDLSKLRQEPTILEWIDFDLCLDRVGWLLTQEKVKPEQVDEAIGLLEMIETQKSSATPSCQYWRAVALTHRRDFEAAAQNLEAVCRLPSPNSAYREAVHFPAWQLALSLHPEMFRRVGEPLLRQPGQRMDAITAIEKQLARAPGDAAAWELKRMLYSELDENEFREGLRNAAQPIDFAYVEQLGLALIDHPTQWRRGCEYLAMTADGVPGKAVDLRIQIARTHEKFGDQAGMWAQYAVAMRQGRAIGVQNMTAEQRKELFGVVKKIAENAAANQEIEVALEAYKFCTQFEQVGLETWRNLSELFERQGNLYEALRCAEHALNYNEKDADLLARKDRYYYSITPEDLQNRLDQYKDWFDAGYCLAKAKGLVDKYNGDLELLDWASHLAELGQIVWPSSQAIRLVRARIRRIRGEMPECVELLEELRKHKPQRFAGDDEQNAWYAGHRMLGELYLDSKPAEAIACFQEFQKSTAAGADTHFKLGRAFENLGDFARAAKCYQEVTVYESHPLYYEAVEALNRVRRAPAT